MSNRKLIGLVGLARSGKNSAADYLSTNHGFAQAQFAAPLKEAARHVFGLSWAEVNGVNVDRETPHPFWGISIREMLQRLGTESVRDVFGEDHWVRLMDQHLKHSTGSTVITDVRFENEVDLIREHGGVVIGLVRTDGQPEIRPHASENLAAFHLDEVTDHVIYASNLPELYQGIENVISVEGANL